MSAPFAKNSLSTKLLLLTLIFVFIAEFVVLVPSIAKQRSDWFGIRFEEAYLASLALEGPREGATDEELVRQLFSTANILGVTINSDDMRMLILAPEINPHGASNILRVDLTQENWMDLIANAWATIFSRGNRLIQATGAPQFAPGQTVDIIVSQQALRRDLHAYARNIFFLSLIISTLTAGLVYWALNRMIVRPVRRLTANIVMFDADPENPGGVLTPSGRKDEIGVAEESLAAMERSVAGRKTTARRRRGRHLENQPRPAQYSGVGPAHVGPTGEIRRPQRQKTQPAANICAGSRHCAEPRHADLWAHGGEAAGQVSCHPARPCR